MKCYITYATPTHVVYGIGNVRCRRPGQFVTILHVKVDEHGTVRINEAEGWTPPEWRAQPLGKQIGKPEKVMAPTPTPIGLDYSRMHEYWSAEADLDLERLGLEPL